MIVLAVVTSFVQQIDTAHMSAHASVVNLQRGGIACVLKHGLEDPEIDAVAFCFESLTTYLRSKCLGRLYLPGELVRGNAICKRPGELATIMATDYSDVREF